MLRCGMAEEKTSTLEQMGYRPCRASAAAGDMAQCDNECSYRPCVGDANATIKAGTLYMTYSSADTRGQKSNLFYHVECALHLKLIEPIPGIPTKERMLHDMGNQRRQAVQAVRGQQ